MFVHVFTCVTCMCSHAYICVHVHLTLAKFKEIKSLRNLLNLFCFFDSMYISSSGQHHYNAILGLRRCDSIMIYTQVSVCMCNRVKFKEIKQQRILMNCVSFFLQ